MFSSRKLISFTLLWSANVVQNNGTNEEGSEADKKKVIINYDIFSLNIYNFVHSNLLFGNNNNL